MARTGKLVALGVALGVVGAILVLIVNEGYQARLQSLQVTNQESKNTDIITHAEQVVARQLKDPSSAQFQNVFISADGKSVCGEFNAKNGFGAYGGFKRFITGAHNSTQGLSQTDITAINNLEDMVTHLDDSRGLVTELWVLQCQR